ncbi:MAG TPA: dihydrolipoamide acetyltransferase family protein, partial [Prosthecobacter sp.]|nr:dihydrolipoamide acetyltransferase family protein [Prosthecobacter sp.]
MPKIIEMPKLSDTMTEGTLAKWLVKEGDKVSTGQALADVETDKATMEMASFFEGTVHKLLVKPGEKAPLNAPLAVVLEEGEEAPANLDEIVAKAKAAAAPAPKAEKTPGGGGAKKAAQASSGPRLPVAPSPTRRAAAAGQGARVKASPLARKIAEERGVDLSRIEGTGPGGRIVRADVESAPVGGGGGSRVSAVPAIRPVAGPEDERVAVSSMRNIIAERLLASKTQIPHFYLQMEVDAGPLMEFRAHLNATSEKTGGNKYTVNDFILKSVIRAAQAQPAINAMVAAEADPHAFAHGDLAF